jgi:uncharacterized DUF497 family protein
MNVNDHNWTRQGVQFACDTKKREANMRKHAMDLFDASAAFFDLFLLSNVDSEHSESEDRENIVGKMPNGKLIHVSYTLRGEVVRLISARKATKTEGQLYGQPY